jgi:hypothetical protein
MIIDVLTTTPLGYVGIPLDEFLRMFKQENRIDLTVARGNPQ